MLIQLIDKDGFKSAVLDIHDNAEEEFIAAIKHWFVWLHYWLERNPKMDGMPLGRLDPDTAMVDLMRELTQRYLLNTPNCNGRIIATFRLQNEDPEHPPKRLNLHDKEFKLL